MEIVKPRTLPGVMELLPREQIAFQRLLATIRDTYELFGFLPVETPVMELKDVLLTKSGGETEKQVYFVQSSGSLAQGEEPKAVLRFDLTVPLARYVAQHEGQLAFPFRRYQMQRVYRGESAQRGRFREFYQCDIDIVGKDSLSLVADAEIPVVIAHLFHALQVGSFTIRLSNRKILMGLLEALGVEDPPQRVLVLREIDKVDKRGAEAVRETLLACPIELKPAVVDVLMNVVDMKGTTDEVMCGLEDLEVRGETLERGIRELSTVIAAMRDFGIAEDDYRVDPAIARGLDYYTGTVYETTLDAWPEIGSVCSGGRYDDLAGHYTKSRLPGVGISIGATRLFYQLREAGLVTASETSTVQVLVTAMDTSLAGAYRRIATLLREEGIRTEVHYEGWKLGKQLKYASRSGIPLAVIMGSDEEARGTVMLKDLRRGEQVEVRLEELPSEVKQRVGVDHE